MNSVRVRFAPAPTGHLHIGSLKIAYLNWLFARRYGGSYVVRVEDTDRERCRQEFCDAIFRTLEWVGLVSDEPVQYQSERTGLYQRLLDQLIAKGSAYRCYCSQDEMQRRVRQVASDGHEYFVYDGFCRNRDVSSDLLGKPSVVRLAVSRDTISSVAVEDVCRGIVEIPISAIDDFVLARSDGSPMYNFTVVADDADMGITHVIRGDDHIVNTPRQVLLYMALGVKPPVFAHVPLILGKDGTKLSKRDAAVSVDAYREMGFLADALCNYLVRLGWSDGNREIIARDSLISLFTLEHVGKKGSHFDMSKLTWMNGEYIKHMAPLRLYALLITDVDPAFHQRASCFTERQVEMAIHVYQQRSRTLIELRDHLDALIRGGIGDAPVMSEAQKGALFAFVELCSSGSYITADDIQNLMQRIVSEHSISFADIAMPIRWALAGSLSAPSVGSLIMVLGIGPAMSRIRGLLLS